MRTPGACVPLLAHFMIGVCAAQPVEYRVVAAEGQQAAGMPAGVTYRSFAMPQLSPLGRVGFAAVVQGTGIGSANDRVLYAENASGLSAVAREGEPAPDASPASLFVEFGRTNVFAQSAPTPGFTATGRFSFAGLTSDGNEGIWSDAGGAGIRMAFRESEPAPGTPHRFEDLFISGSPGPATGSQGHLAISAKLVGEGLAANQDTGVWATDSGGQSAALVAREGSLAPGLGSGVLFQFFGQPEVSASGRVVFFGRFAGGEVTGATNEAVWSWTPSGGLAIVARKGSAAPGFSPGTVLTAVGARLSGNGRVIVRGVIGGPDPSINENTNEVIFRELPGGALEAVYREGLQAPGLPAGTAIVSIGEFYTDEIARIAFRSKLAGPGVDGSNDDCFWYEADGQGLVLGAREGDQAPGFPPGYTFRSFRVAYSSESLGPDPSFRVGRIAFTGELLWPGFDPLNPLVGSWVSDLRGELRAVAPPGTPITIAPRNTKTIERSQILPTGSVNDSDMVAAWVRFTDGTSALVVEGIDLGCVADVNGDGVTTPADFSAWVAAFNTGSLPCDQNFNGQCSPADFSAWVSNYALGCP